MYHLLIAETCVNAPVEIVRARWIWMRKPARKNDRKNANNCGESERIESQSLMAEVGAFKFCRAA
jgi:hypothetical protein